MIGTFWKSHAGNTFEVLRIWTDRRPEWDKPIRWVEVRQHGGAFNGESFKWCLESLFAGGAHAGAGCVLSWGENVCGKAE